MDFSSFASLASSLDGVRRKLPLPHAVDELYFKRFSKLAPDTVLSIEDRVRLEHQKKEARRAVRRQPT